MPRANSKNGKRRAGSIRGKIIGGFTGLYVLLYLAATLVMGAAAYIACYYTVREQAWQRIETAVRERLALIALSGEDPRDAAQWSGLTVPGYIADYALITEDRRIVAAPGAVPEAEQSRRIESPRCDSPILSLGGRYYDFTGHIWEDPTKPSAYFLVYFSIDAAAYIGQLAYSGALFLIIPAASLALFAAGLVIVVLFGAARTSRYLSPIREVTRLTRQLSAQNLNLRLDPDTARFELREMVVTINEMLDRIHAGMARQKAFVSDVSHELRTPLSVMSGYANILKRWARDDEKVFDEAVDAIIGESENMKTLVENLLFLVRSDNNTLVFNRETFDLTALLTAIEQETLLLDGGTHRVTSEIEQGVMVWADRAKIKQALRVFVENALKYTPPDGAIHLSMRREGDCVRILVRDTGIGIPTRDLGHIFTRFYRGDRSRNRQTGGYGLGLPIARAILSAHGGRIRISSREGAGTSVEAELPAPAQEPRGHGSPAEPIRSLTEGIGSIP
jgi:signal transduction histidine kinase